MKKYTIYNQILNLSLILLVSMFFTACGENTTNLQDTAIDKLEAYASSNGSSEVPTLQDYIDAGVVGVDDTTKLAEINEVVSGLNPEDVDTSEEVQALADSLGIVVPEDTVFVPDPDTAAPIITLNGASALNVVQFTSYIEEEATAIDIIDGTVEVSITGTVDTNTVGVYNLTYTATDLAGNTATALRTVTVTRAADNTAPVITLNGASALNVVQFTAYTEQGATAIDDRDSIVIVHTSGTVDTNTTGDYNITYTARDSAGNAATAIRTVTVTRAPDTTAPVIILNGASTVNVVLNQSYIEQNATATDDRDSNVTVVITEAVNTSILGDYSITYTAIDLAGNHAIDVIRTVSVVRWSREASTEIVTDHQNGVMWQDDANAKTIKKDWQEAKGYCSDLGLGGYDNWTLPEKDRLFSIVDIGKTPKINAVFRYVFPYLYWSSTTVADTSTHAWVVDFDRGHPYSDPKDFSYSVRCVRAEQ